MSTQNKFYYNPDNNNKRARRLYLEDAEYWEARAAAYTAPPRPPFAQQRRDDHNDGGGRSDHRIPASPQQQYQQQQYQQRIIITLPHQVDAGNAADATECRSPYSLNSNPTRVWVMHSVQGRGVHGMDYGPVGAPFPERRVVVGTETGCYDSEGAFQPDPWFPRKMLVRVGRWPRVVAFEVGKPGEAYPLRAVAVFRWGKMQVGKIVIADGSDGPAAPEFVTMVEETIDKFAGLQESDLDPDQFAEPVSTAVWTALAGLRQRCETINKGGRLVGVPSSANN